MSESAVASTMNDVVPQKPGRGRKKAEGSVAPKQKPMSPVVSEIETGVKGVTAVVREDGTVTVVFKALGVAAKTITAYPIQWVAISTVLEKMKGKFDI